MLFHDANKLTKIENETKLERDKERERQRERETMSGRVREI